MYYEDFFRKRLTELRIKKGISEYELSRSLGHSRGYIYNITSGKSLPPLSEFFSICEYFDVTPSQFFDDKVEQPILIQKSIECLKKLD